MPEVSETPIPGITELEDGSAIVEDVLSSDEPQEETNFYANLAETLDIHALNSISANLIELIERDKECRKERDKQQEEGIRRTGLGNDAPGGATFDGASRIVHPVMAEGCVDFSARAIKELFPANGPVRTKVVGKVDDKVLEKARKKRDFLNFYLTERMPEYRDEKEILLTQLPLGGSQYEKYWFDGKRVRMEFVPVDKVFLPFSANSFYAASRITHEKELTQERVEALVEEGFYRDVFGLANDNTEESASEKATQKIEGKDPSGYNEDGVRIIYEVACNYDVEGSGAAPYIIHIDEPSEEVIAIYRNWAESDEDKKRLDWWVEDKFIPWRGAYGIGLPHLIGGLSASLTGALRALLDSAHINNAPTAIKLKGGRTSGQNAALEMTAITEIEAPTGTDDIRKVMMPMPFNPPSAVLFQLLDWITNQAKGVVATAEERIADAGANMPVGTALALIEQGSQVFSSIHSRLHEAQRKALRIICRLIADNPEHALADMGRFDLVPQDFLASDDVEPVSDPNIFSEAQRFAQMQSVMQLAAGDAQDPSLPWNKLALRRRMLELLRVDGIDELLPSPPEPVTADPVSENVACMEGKILKAHEAQDHLAHIQAHLLYIFQPLVAQGSADGRKLSLLMAHINEHISMDHIRAVQMAEQLIRMENPGASPDQIALQAMMKAQEAKSQSDMALAQELQQAQQLIQSKMPPPQVDPAIQATKEVAMAQVQQKQAHDAAQLQFEQQKFAQTTQLEQQKSAQEMQFRQQELNLRPMFEEMQQRFDLQIKQFEEAMANERNENDNRMHQITELMKNREDNETELMLELQKTQQNAADSIFDKIRALFGGGA